MTSSKTSSPKPNFDKLKNANTTPTTLSSSEGTRIHSSTAPGAAHTSSPTHMQAATKTPSPQFISNADNQRIQQQQQGKQLTKVVVKSDVGFKNEVYIRGHGANLSWSHGIKLKNVSANEWVWETTQPFQVCEFKVLINDQHYEAGKNHIIEQGTSFEYVPHF